MVCRTLVYGEVVPAASFVDRETRARTVTTIARGQKVFLISPRRYGKSALVVQALRAAPANQGALTVDVTVSRYSLRRVSRGLARARCLVETRVDKARRGCGTCSAACAPSSGWSRTRQDGRSWRSHSPGRGRTRMCHGSPRRLALPGKIATHASASSPSAARTRSRRSTPSTGGSVEHACAPPLSTSARSATVFPDPNRRLMERMLGKSRPFYKAGPVMRLQKIPEDRFAAFLEARFRATGIKPVSEFGSAIVELAGNLPYDVQRLAHEVWDDARAAGRKTVNLDDLHLT